MHYKTPLSLTTIFFTALNTNIAHAVTELEPFTTKCTSTDQVGFYQKDGKWKGSFFNNDTYTVKKFSKNELKEIDSRCLDEINTSNAKFQAAGNAQVFGSELIYTCYDIYREGNKRLFGPNPSKCYEKYTLKGKLNGIYCDDFMFNPNGEFIKKPSIAIGNIEKDWKGKRNFVMGAGNCKVQ